jgi:hypothetical protein
MKKSTILSVFVLGLMSVIAAVPALAGSVVLYDNGPSTYNLSAASLGLGCITGCVTVTDSFTLSSNSTVTGVNFVTWLQGNSLPSVDWAISSTPVDSASSMINIMQSFVAANTTQINIGTYINGFDVFDIVEESFSIPNLSLPAGAYYLTLGTTTVGVNNAYWDMNDGPSTASLNYCFLAGGNCSTTFNNRSIGSESFQILGEEASPIPEPSSFLLLGSGLAGLVGLIKRKLMA